MSMIQLNFKRIQNIAIHKKVSKNQPLIFQGTKEKKNSRHKWYLTNRTKMFWTTFTWLWFISSQKQHPFGGLLILGYGATSINSSTYRPDYFFYHQTSIPHAELGTSLMGYRFHLKVWPCGTTVPLSGSQFGGRILNFFSGTCIEDMFVYW